MTGMEDILRRYSPEPTPENTGEAYLGKPRPVPANPQKTFDLHGFFVDEAVTQTVWFLQDAHREGLRKVRVITGQGKDTAAGYSVLYLEIKKLLTQQQARKKIRMFDPQPGYFDIILPE